MLYEEVLRIIDKSNCRELLININQKQRLITVIGSIKPEWIRVKIARRGITKIKKGFIFTYKGHKHGHRNRRLILFPNNIINMFIL